MKKFMYLLFLSLLLISCAYTDKYDEKIVKDVKTGDYYLLRHHIGDTYFITELDSLSLKESNYND